MSRNELTEHGAQRETGYRDDHDRTLPGAGCRLESALSGSSGFSTAYFLIPTYAIDPGANLSLILGL